MTDSIDTLLRTAGLGQRYRVLETFDGGEGGSARIERVGDTETSLHLKVCSAGLEELAALSALKHPRIPALVEFGEIPGLAGACFVVREFAEGRPLASGRRETSEVEQIAVDLTETLAFVHGLGFVHGDLKPSNLIESGGRVQLIDFGLSDVSSGGGTPGFAAPERERGASARSDLFSLGVVLLTCLFEPQEIDREVLREDFGSHLFDRLPVRDRGWSARLHSVLRSMLEPDPSRRAVDAREVLDRLVGGSGRPSIGRLQLDPFTLWPVVREQLGDVGAEVLELTGADSWTRQTMLLDRSRRLDQSGSMSEGVDRTVFSPGGSEPVTVDRAVQLGEVESTALAVELQRLFRLDEPSAAKAATWLIESGACDREGLEARLKALYRDGLIVPAGTGFAWPDAQSSRLRALGEPSRSTEAQFRSPEELRALVRDGAIELGESILRQKQRSGGADLDVWRGAVAEGLLDLGEAARALPLTFDQPLARAKALLGLSRLDDAESILDSVEDDEKSALPLRADLASRRGRHDQALNLMGAAQATIETRVLESCFRLRAGEDEAALSAFESLVDEGEVRRIPNLAAVVRSNLGESRRRAGNFSGARLAFEEARAMRRDQGNLRQMAVLDLNLGVLHRQSEEFGEALTCQRRALDTFRFLQDRETAAIALLNLAVLHRERGDLGAARGCFDEASDELQELGHRALEPFLAVFGARITWQEGGRAESLRWLARVGRPTFDPRTEGELESWLAEVEEVLESSTANEEAADPSGVRMMRAINRRLATSPDASSALRIIVDASLTVTGARSAYVVVEREGAIQTEMKSDGTPPRDRAFSLSLANRAIHEGRTLRESDVLEDRALRDMPSVRNLDRRSALCAPFETGSGLRGALYVEHVGRSNVFDETAAELLESLADQAAIALSLSRLDRDLAPSRSAEAKPDSTPSPTRRRRRTVDLLGKSPPIEKLRSEILKIGRSGMSVLVHGETGTGKELVARALHREGPGPETPFVGENCSAIPAELIESELFGSVKGAFTGAEADRAGLFEQANGGTLFLDEIGDMPLSMQVKLLRALQEGVIRRVGGREAIPVSFQVVTATHRDLRAMVSSGEFREDLYFRLAAGVLRVPALRERGDDVLLLCDDWVARLNKEHGRNYRRSPELTERLLAYDWPGNVRELQHVLSRAFLLADGEELSVDQVPTEASESAETESAFDWPVLTIEEATRRTIRAALRRTNGDKTKAARLLGMSRTALYDRLKREPDLGPSDGRS